MTERHQRSTNILQRWGAALTTWTERWIPDALVIVWILTAVCFIFALLWGDASPVSAVKAWGNGFWVLLEFGMQVCLTMMTDMIQPFWAIAMLAIVKLEFREIMGRLLLVFFVYFGVTSVAFFVWPLL